MSGLLLVEKLIEETKYFCYCSGIKQSLTSLLSDLQSLTGCIVNAAYFRLRRRDSRVNGRSTDHSDLSSNLSRAVLPLKIVRHFICDSL